MSFPSGGLRCAATLYRPDSVDGALPCVVMSPGGTLTQRDGIPDYAERFAAAGFAALAFDYRHWGDSEGEPRRWISFSRQLDDLRAAVAYARGLEGIDPKRVAVWGMSFGGGHALMAAAADADIAAVVALVPMVDGLALWLRPAPPGNVVRLIWRALREVITRHPVTVPVAGPPDAFAVFRAPEAQPGFERVAGPHGWRNEVNTTIALTIVRYRPVRRAAAVRAPVLLQLGEHDGIVPLAAIEKTAARARRAELVRYPIDHFECFSPEHLERVAGDQIDFLRRHVGATSGVTCAGA